MPISESHPLGREAALRALELDESLAEAHRSLAEIIGDHYWDWGEVERHYTRAIALDPNDVTTLRFYSFYLAYTGRPLEALPIAEQACRLDPVSPNARMNLGVVLRLARRPDEAARQFEETLERDPNFSLAQALLGLAYLSNGMPDRAFEWLQSDRGAVVGVADAEGQPAFRHHPLRSQVPCVAQPDRSAGLIRFGLRCCEDLLSKNTPVENWTTTS